MAAASTEPVRLASTITAALTATLALLAFVGVPLVAIGALTAALSAWVVVVFEIVRARVAPVESPAPEPAPEPEKIPTLPSA